MKLHPLPKAAKLMNIDIRVLYEFINKGVMPCTLNEKGTRKFISDETIDLWLDEKIKVSGVYDLEKQVQRKVISELPKDVKAIKIHKHNWPDYLFVMPKGRNVWIEFKRYNKEPRRGQFKILNMLKDMGQFARWFNNPSDALEYLMEVYNGD